LFGGAVYDDWNEERLVFSHVAGTLNRQSPFTTEVALEPLVRMLGDNRNEQHAVVDLLADGYRRTLSLSRRALISGKVRVRFS
jgi:hypothetical protein